MKAIVEINGKQYQLEEGRYTDIERYDAEPETALTFENVNLVIDGEKSHIGAPYVSGAKVSAKVMMHDRAKKIIVFKMKRKKGYRRKQGHRQSFTRIMVESISVK